MKWIVDNRSSVSDSHLFHAITHLMMNEPLNPPPKDGACFELNIGGVSKVDLWIIPNKRSVRMVAHDTKIRRHQ